MPWMQLKFTPGIVKDRTRYAANGTWYDGNLVRFRDGLPEEWGGWVRVFPDLEAYGLCRAMHRFSDLKGFQWMGAGTSHRFYMISDDLYYDVTPVKSSENLTTDPLAATDGSTTVVVFYSTSATLFPGDTILISGATTFAGIPADDLNKQHIITGYIDDTRVSITVATPATSDDAAGGGAAVVMKVIYNAGSDDQFYGGGWGAGVWNGDDPWGGDPAAGVTDKMGIWSMDNWGEDLVANAQKGPIFYWDATNPSSRMVNIRSLAGADGNAPTQSEFIIVSHKDRHLLSFGCTSYATGLVEPMTVRWCSQENILNWDEADTIGTAGSLPLSRGSRFIAVQGTQQEILAWSDQAVYSLRYIGAPFIYGADIVADFSDILGMKAATVMDSSVFWMGRSGFYTYSGRVERLNSPVWDYVQQRIDFGQATKVVGTTNRMHNEIIWFYPSVDGDGEIDSYVTLDMTAGVWSIGSLGRTAWLDMDTLNPPIAASVDNRFYEHEIGADDGSQDPPAPLGAYIESAPLELSSEGSFDKGDKMMFIRRILPDMTFRNFSEDGSTPNVDITLKMMDKPGGGFDNSTSGQVVRSVTLPVEEFTDQLHVRLRGRSLTLRIDNAGTGTLWRLGIPRIDVRTDGQR